LPGKFLGTDFRAAVEPHALHVDLPTVCCDGKPLGADRNNGSRRSRSITNARGSVV
jgi:hypothetical protein